LRQQPAEAVEEPQPHSQNSPRSVLQPPGYAENAANVTCRYVPS
jgi:hypothetical protein